MTLSLLNSGAIGDRRLVYLDTADWSYLESGGAREHADTLSSAATRGEVAYLLSFDHFVELAGLTSGYEARKKFLRRFPGTLLLAASGRRLLQLEANLFASRVLSTHAEPAAFSVRWLCDVPEEEIDDAVAAAGYARRAHTLSAWAEEPARDARGDREQQRHNEKLFTFLLRNDMRGLERWLTKKSLLRGGFVGRLQMVTLRTAATGLGIAQSYGLFPSLDRSDPAFERIVAMNLPRHVRGDKASMKAIQRAWRDKPLRLSMATSLSVVAALEEHTYRQTFGPHNASAALDKMHAAFAPLCGLFTCDKRNRPIVQRVLEEAKVGTRVLNTGSLSAVALSLQQNG